MKRQAITKSKGTKVSIKDKNLWNFYGVQVATLASLVTILSFCAPLPQKTSWKIGASMGFVAVLVFLFLWNWRRANQTDYANLKINGTNVSVCIGDLFSQEGLKIIGVNNYIDLVADDIVVSRTTLHGQFIMGHKDEINEIKEAIANSSMLSPEINADCPDRKSYGFGSCVLYQDYVLTVLTRFDSRNKAYTSIREYIQFWMTFWENIDALYNSQTINIPIMGAGQTRFRETKLEKQELLEIALWTLKKSGFHNNYADKKINFVIYDKDAPEINFYHIKNIFG